MSKQIYTIILRLDNGDYHVAECVDPEKYIKNRNTDIGYWARNKGGAKLIKIYKGEYKDYIKRMSVVKFVEIQLKEAELEYFMINLKIG